LVFKWQQKVPFPVIGLNIMSKLVPKRLVYFFFSFFFFLLGTWYKQKFRKKMVQLNESLLLSVENPRRSRAPNVTAVLGHVTSNGLPSEVSAENGRFKCH